jgi:hypothetical protein
MDSLSDSDIKSLKSIRSFDSSKYTKYDTIPLRLGFIEELLGGKNLKPMFEPNNGETINFMGGGTPDPKENSGNLYKSVDSHAVLGKKLYDFYKVIKKIGGSLNYIKSGTTGHTFRAVKETEDGKLNYGVKVSAYPKRERYGDVNDTRRPENAELVMIRLLSYFVINRQSPHITLPVFTFNTSIKPFVNLIEKNVVSSKNQKYKQFVERYKKGDYHKYVSVLISEWANKGDFLEFSRKYYKRFKLIHWKVFFFQFISTLAVIQSKYPSFRHNDMKANNLLVHKVDLIKENSKFRYTINDCDFVVNNIGYQLKLWDFDFACIPGRVDNSKVAARWTDEINVSPVKNKYYDMHYFFNTLIKKGFFDTFLKSNLIPKEAKEFVHRIVPNKFKKGKYVTPKGRILINDEYSTPDEVIKTDPFFDEFRLTKFEPYDTEYGKELKKLLNNKNKSEPVQKFFSSSQKNESSESIDPELIKKILDNDSEEEKKEKHKNKRKKSYKLKKKDSKPKKDILEILGFE